MSGPADSIRRALAYAQEGNVLGPREAAAALAELGTLEAERDALRKALESIRDHYAPKSEDAFPVAYLLARRSLGES